MQVDRPFPEDAAARLSHLRLAEARDERAQKDHGRAHFLHRLRGYLRPAGGFCVNGKRPAAAQHPAAKAS